MYVSNDFFSREKDEHSFAARMGLAQQGCCEIDKSLFDKSCCLSQNILSCGRDGDDDAEKPLNDAGHGYDEGKMEKSKDFFQRFPVMKCQQTIKHFTAITGYQMSDFCYDCKN